MDDDNKSLRQKWIAYWRDVYAAWAAGQRDTPPIPPELHDLTCGAKTRAGTPCQLKGLYRSGRCKLHGGLSTGPTTPEGKARAALNWKGVQGGDEPHEGLTKPNITLDQNGESTVDKPQHAGEEAPAAPTAQVATVRCVNCAFMSAGYTCTKGLGHGISAGTPRICLSFCEATAWKLGEYGGHR